MLKELFARQRSGCWLESDLLLTSRRRTQEKTRFRSRHGRPIARQGQLPYTPMEMNSDTYRATQESEIDDRGCISRQHPTYLLTSRLRKLLQAVRLWTPAFQVIRNPLGTRSHKRLFDKVGNCPTCPCVEGLFVAVPSRSKLCLKHPRDLSEDHHLPWTGCALSTGRIGD